MARAAAAKSVVCWKAVAMSWRSRGEQRLGLSSWTSFPSPTADTPSGSIEELLLLTKYSTVAAESSVELSLLSSRCSLFTSSTASGEAKKELPFALDVGGRYPPTASEALHT